MNNVSFKLWQQKFYKSKEWKKLRKQVELNSNGICNRCGKLIYKKGDTEIDHINEINIYNCFDKSVILNIENLQLLCHNCHNVKTSIDKNCNKTSLLSGLENDFLRRDKW